MDGYAHRLALIVGKRILLSLPLFVAHSLIIARRDDRKVRRLRVVDRSDAHLETLLIDIGSLSHKTHNIVLADSDCRRNQPIIIGRTAISAHKAHILLATVGTQHGIIGPPRRLHHKRIDHLRILQRAAVRIRALKRSGGSMVAVDARPRRKLRVKRRIALEIIEKHRILTVPLQRHVVLARHRVVALSQLESKRIAHVLRERHIQRHVARHRKILSILGIARTLHRKTVVSAIHLQATLAGSIERRLARTVSHTVVCLHKHHPLSLERLPGGSHNLNRKIAVARQRRRLQRGKHRHKNQ